METPKTSKKTFSATTATFSRFLRSKTFISLMILKKVVVYGAIAMKVYTLHN